MRGFLGGVSIGAMVAAAGAAMLSLSAPLPTLVDVTVDTPAEIPEPVDATALPVESSGPDADLVEAAPTAPVGAVEDDLTGLQGVDTQPASRPEVGSAETVLSDPQASVTGLASSPEISQQTDSPVTPIEALPAPVAPNPEAAIEVASEPAQPPQPVVVPEVPQMEPETDIPELSNDIASSDDTVPAQDRGPDIEDGSETADVTDVATAETVATPEVVVDVPVMTAPSAGTTPVTTFPAIVDAPVTAPVPGEARDDASLTPSVEPDAEEESEQVAALPGTSASQEGGDMSIGTRVVPLTERGKPDGETSTAAPKVSPFETYAEPLDNPEGRPLMAIVLIDDAQSIGAEALVGFPYPLSFAIDPEDPKAAEKMAARRAAGFEVLILTNLPREAAPQDAETALAVWFDTLPESIGVLEGTGTGFQGNRPLADQVSAVVAASGRGMLTQDHGLNTVQKLAARDGVPAAVVFRDFDGAGQNPRAIRRFLDQAAFRAGQEGAVVMLGRVRPDTISALLLWGLQDRATRVSLAPVSAALSLQATNR